MITGQIFFLTMFLTLTWGAYLRFSIKEYVRVRANPKRTRGDVIAAMRRLIVAFSLWMLPTSFLIRTGIILIGFGDVVAGQVLFFSLAGTNVVGSIFVAISLRFD